MALADRLPEATRRRAELAGAQGQAWLAGLDGLLADLTVEWGFTAGDIMPGGTEGAVIEATLADGRAAVLKLSPPFSDTADRQLRVLLGGGDSYPEVHRHDDARRAILMERLGPQLHDLGLPFDRQLEIICETLRGAWTRPADGHDFPTGADKAADLSVYIVDEWEALDRPVSRRVVDQALAFTEARAAAFDPARSVLAHGDAHAWNTLQVPGAPDRFKFVDPEGLFIEPEYDLAIPMREWGDVLWEGDPARLGKDRARRLARLTGLDPLAIWQWGFIEKLSTGLSCLRIGLPQARREFLDIAERWAADPDLAA